ncbi:TetR/AcrR family transcriptional regulator [Micromonospora sp. KC723]|uniref:TetR/AcrR family transcriptional regulator n=1 Tax=Micromonospora sp. KC723 TaxID=2530381 RepID=UPI00140475A1|nr:TetR/AcrR family transcriptional regulator [Micromonospora sp. KC723]
MARQQVDDPRDEPTVRDRLIAGARDVLQGAGIADLTVRKVATAAGRSTMCVYTKFGNRRGMVEAVYESVLDDLVAEITPPAGSRPDALVEGWALALRDWSMRYPEPYRLVFDYPLGQFEVSDDVRIAAIDRVVAVPAEQIGAERAHRVWATCHGLLALERAYGARKPAWSGSPSLLAYYRSTLRDLLEDR